MSFADEVAVGAARLVVEEGLEYGAAKRKAARDLGRRGGRRGELPRNEQVEDEVRACIELFCADTQPAELRALRELALGWMQRLAAFRPHLSGAVWRGTATRQSSIHMDLYCDDSKSAQIGLLNLGIDADLSSLERPGAEPLSVLTVGARCAALGELVTLHLIVRDLDEQRGALKPDARGRSWRGDIAAVQRQLAIDEDQGATEGKP